MSIKYLLPLVILLGCYLLSPSVANADGEPPIPRTSYYIDAQLDYPAGSMTVFERVHYYNRTDQNLNSVVFNVTPAYYNAFFLTEAAVGGMVVTTTLSNVNLEVPLSSTLRPGQFTDISLDFRLDIPRRGGRLGIADGVIALGNWFPIANPYVTGRLVSPQRPIGWARHKYVETGDAFFTETADFEVTLVTSKPVEVAHSGYLVSHEGNDWDFKAENARDFAMAISSQYLTQSLVTNGITVTAYYLPEHPGVASQYLDAASKMVTWMSDTVFPYPYPTLCVAEVNPYGSNFSGGQEYPGLVFLTSALVDQGGSIDSYLYYLVMHEVAHQWYYGIIGNDQIYSPWLDEAMVTWMTDDFLRANNPSIFPSAWQRRVTSLLPDRSALRFEIPVSGGIYDFPDEGQYFDVVYRRGAAFLEEVYQLMGRKAFYEAIRDYTATFRFGISTPLAFLSRLQSNTPVDLRPIVSDYFGGQGTYRLAGPNAIYFDVPATVPWAGIIQPVITSTLPITNVSVFVDNNQVGQSDGSVIPELDTRKLPDGVRLLTVRAITSDGNMSEFNRQFTIYNPVTPTPIPVELSAPAPIQDQEQVRDPALHSLSVIAVLGLFMVTVAIGRSIVDGSARLDSPYRER